MTATKMTPTTLLALAALSSAGAAACQRSLEGAGCPCLSGWTCCAAENMCVPDGASCPGAGGDRDGGNGTGKPTVFPEVCTLDGWCGITPPFSAVWGSADDDIWVAARGLGDNPTSSLLLRFDGTGWSPAGWQPAGSAASLDQDIQALWGSGRDDVFAVGNWGLVLHFDGAGWTEQGVTVWPSLRAVSGTGPGDVWAVGTAGGVIHYDGAAWTQSPAVTTADLGGVWARARDDAWAVGAAGTILRWDGAIWTRYQDAFAGTPTTHDLAAVWGSGPDDVWAAGTGGTVLHFNGNVWTSLGGAVPTTQDLVAIWGDGPENVWVAGASGALVHWNGSGWFSAPTGTTEALHGLWGSRSGDVWVVGDDSTTVHWNGAAWATSPLPAFSGVAFSAVGGTAPDDVWVAGTMGTWGLMYHFDGQAWTACHIDLPVAVEHIWAIARGRAFTVGLAGILDMRVLADGSCTDWADPTVLTPVHAIWGSAPDDIWAGGDYAGTGGGVMQHWDGQTWQGVAIPTTQNVQSLWGFAADDVRAVLGTDTVLRWDGSSWTSSAPFPSSQGETVRWSVVYGTGSDDVWLHGSYTVSSYMNGSGGPAQAHWDSSQWTTQSSYSIPRSGAWLGAPRQLWVCGGGVDIWDANAWTRSYTGVGPATGLYGIWGSGLDDIWAVGDGGTMLRRRR
jgi:hypothetical protein